jgi:hypothetical protein
VVHGRRRLRERVGFATFITHSLLENFGARSTIAVEEGPEPQYRDAIAVARVDARLDGRITMGRIENHDGRAWRARAVQCRAIADSFDNPETRTKMYGVAADYDRMAEHAERRERECAAQDASALSPSRKRTVDS